ncbi:MAG: hypothetical protein J7M25_16945 [Deltaproteobacteria bacterium]|nr:hypothetical protein [Deltaproteobacteria bacterium]
MRKQVRLMVLLAAVSAMAATALVGCKDKPSCKLLYKRYNKCEKDFPMKEKAFLKLCKKMKEKSPAVKEELKCSVKKNCDAFKKCLKGAKKKAAAARITKEIDKALASKKYGDALSTCKYSKKNLTDDLKKKCADLSASAYKEFLAKATAGRDAGKKKDWKVCSTLKDAAKAINKTAEAEAICNEWDMADSIQKTLAKTAAALKKAKVPLPYECDWTAKKLAKIKTPSPWVKKQTKLVVDACYVKVAKKYLAQHLAARYKFCGFQMRGILKYVKQFGVKDAELDPLVAKATAICTKAKK